MSNRPNIIFDCRVSDGSGLFVAGLSYKTAPVAIREQFAVPPSGREAAAAALLGEGGLSEVVLLWTCNRVEVYGICGETKPAPEHLMQLLVRRPLQHGTGVYGLEGGAAMRHLFRVASGLDSMVLGETEITGQVKTAYEGARASGHTGRRLNRLFQKALETAKAVRTRTAIGRGAASVGSVAVQHAQKIFGSSLAGRSVMVIGAGDMAEKCLRHLIKKGVASIVVVNRSVDRAEQLAARFGGSAVSFGRCLEAMTGVDMVITSTGCPHVVLERGDIETVIRGRGGRPLVILDIAVPRDVAPEVRGVPGVHLHDIEDLEDTVRENIRYREQDLAVCELMIQERATELESWMNLKAGVPA